MWYQAVTTLLGNTAKLLSVKTTSECKNYIRRKKRNLIFFVIKYDKHPEECTLNIYYISFALVIKGVPE